MLDPEVDDVLRSAFTNTPSGVDAEVGDKEIFDAFDVAIAVPRGIGNALGEIYDLADTLTFDLLPDTPDGRLFGESNSVVGGVVEGIAQFSTAFIPVVGAISKANKFSKVGRVFRGLSTAAERARRVATGSGRLISLQRAAVAGVIADAAAFDGHESRLSNLIQEHPSLANPVTEFLAADENDSELEGRLKSALEGLGLGFAVDTVTTGIRAAFAGDGAVAGLKGIKAKRLAKAAGKSDEEAAAEGAKAYTKSLEEEQASAFATEAVEDLRTPVESAEAFGFKKENVQKALDNITEAAKPGLDPRVNPRTLIKEDPLGAFHRGLLGDEVNLAQFPTHEGASVIRGIEEQLVDGFKGIDPESLADLDEKALRQIADVTSTDPDVVLATLNADLIGETKAVERLRARIHSIAYAQAAAVEKLRAVSKDVVGGSGIRSEAEMIDALEFIAQSAQNASNARSQLGRSLRSLRGPVATTPIHEVQRLIDSGGGSDKLRKVAMKTLEVIETSGVVGIGKVANRAQKGLNITLEYWMNALLSGPKTQIVNGLSNFLVGIYRPFEKIAGGGIGKLLGQGQSAQDTLDVGIHELSGMYHGFRESLGIAAQSLVNNAPVLDPHFRKVDITEGVTSSALENIDPSKLTGRDRALHAMGTVMRFPTRMLSTTDEFFKQMNFRSSLYAELHLKASKLGIESADIPEYIKTNFDNYIENGQALTTRDAYKKAATNLDQAGLSRSDPDFKNQLRSQVSQDFDSGIAQRALDSAREGTFTQELRKGTIGRQVQNTINSHPYLRFFMPFIRTPINLLNFAGQRLDVPGLVAVMRAQSNPKFRGKLAGSNNRLIQDALSNDPRRKFEALGRLSLGFSAASYFMSQAANGSITGRGPTDTNHRRLLESTGWKPYSILVGDRYVSYQRIDPFATIIGISADLVTYGQYASTEDQTDAEAALGALVSALSNNVTQKSYLTGMANIVGVLEDPERNAGKYLQGLAASFVPNIANQAEDVSDPYLRDARTFVDAISARIPGLSDNLPPIRNILGEKVLKPRSLGADSTADITNFFLPIQYASVSSEPIEKELLALGHGFTVPSRIQGGVDLTTIKDSRGNAVYDRFQELTGTEKVYGRTLRDTLTRLIKSRAYQTLPQEGLEGEDSPRVGEINKVLRRFRHAAITTLRKEIPELQAATDLQRQARKGISPSLLR